ncbi:pyridoxal-dependent decarboxylase [Streptomyces sp. A7024]|uniref:Pyridoxal-dependent decarboxylase n=1 Tax=Streptomyces coryli TaxID=1128680 RepID=A0A6G4TZY5_9ACTN|nr:pyridoxal-dependent decarboxylase [Streptomyces coryli]NGN64551.1 pyridoxal-dependent decarboxylase [Streptomyces coryli]
MESMLRAFKLAPDGRTRANTEDLRELAHYFRSAQRKMLGYQWSQDIDMPKPITDFLDLHLDNIGDPMANSLTKLNTKFLEQEVLKYFAHLWHAPPLAGEDSTADPATRAASWGYVLSMGSTEGTLYCLWNARDYLAGRDLCGTVPGGQESAARKPLLFASREVHYSFAKAAQMLQLDMMGDVGSRDFPGQCPITDDGTWPLSVPTEACGKNDGLVDAAALAQLIDFFAARGYAPIVVCNVGSTFKGAIDDPRAIWDCVQPVLERHGLLGSETQRRGYWIHVDGALGAGYLPFLEMAGGYGNAPVFDFRLPYVCSIVTSGHKWFGTPYPTGVYLTRNELRVAPPSKPGYVGSPDTTIGGARDGLAPLLLWAAISQRTHDRQIEAVERCLRLAAHTHERLGELGPHIAAERARNALAIRFLRPAEHIMRAFGLVGQQTPGPDGRLRDEAHLYVMPHVTDETIDSFLEAMAAPDAYDTNSA